MVDDVDRAHLRRCVELANAALGGWNAPFGSVLVGPTGRVLYEDHNRNAGGDNTAHPELAIARWATQWMTSEERASATVYTSGEHCPMCAAAHASVGLGRIVYATSSAQLRSWREEVGATPGPVRPFPICEVAPGLQVEGPVAEFVEEVRELQRRYHHHRQRSEKSSSGA